MLFKWIQPWEFSWTFLTCFLIGCALYLRGSRRLAPSLPRKCSFWLGMALLYVSLHTYFDYYAEHEFSMHRLQQLFLHHLAPLLIVVSYPGSVLRAGLPFAWRVRLHKSLRYSKVWHTARATLLNPTVVTITFVAFILIWLVPSLQTVAMLDWRIYRIMNWSMLASGLAYWSLVLDHRPHPPGRMMVGMRVLSPVATMAPQILAGAIVTFSRNDLYPIFELCGRAFAFDVLTGQLVGGLIMWVPASMVEAAGSLLALRHWMHLSRNVRIRRQSPAWAT